MSLTDFQKQLLLSLVRARLDGASLYLALDDVAGDLNSTPSTVADALGAVSAWCSAEALPDVASTVISAENAGRMVMLPPQPVIDRLGGDAAARDEANRVRDFDWRSWLDA